MPGRNGRTSLKWWKKITYSPDYCTQQGSHSNMKEKSKALQTSKSWENSAPPTSSSTNAKGSSLDKKHRKGLQTRTQNNKLNGNGIILNNNYLKCKWIECPNQKTKTGWMDTKTRPLYMLSTRDPPQNKGHIWIESEGLEKMFHANRDQKKKKKKRG